MPELEKYRELYTLAWRVYEEEQARSNRHETKAGTLLSALTLFVGASGFFGKWVIEFGTPPRGSLQWLVILCYGALVASLLTAWILTFRSLSLNTMRKVPLNDEMVRAFKDSRLIDLYYSLSLKLSREHQSNSRTVDRKMRSLSRGYIAVGVSVLMFALFCVLYAICAWGQIAGGCHG